MIFNKSENIYLACNNQLVFSYFVHILQQKLKSDMNIYVECNSNILKCYRESFLSVIVIFIVIIKMFLYSLILFYYLVYLLKWNEHLHDIFFIIWMSTCM